jgi:putative acetyltransferase
MMIRSYQPSDAEAIAAVYKDAVIGTGASAYNAQQVAIWSSYPEDLEAFRDLLGQGSTLVALQGDRLVAFGQLHPLDHVAFLYTASDCGRQGYAGGIYQQLEAFAREQGVTRLYTEASRISKLFFLKVGFQILETEWVKRQGLEFERFKMEKWLL